MPHSIFTSQTPASTNLDNGNPIHLHTYFTPSVNGTVTHIRWYFPTTSQSGVKAALFRTSDSTKQSSVTDAQFTDGLSAGWQQVALSPPVAVTSGVQYSAAVRTPRYYVVSNGGSSPWPITNGNLTAPSGAGRFDDADTADVIFGTSSFNSGAYFVDVVFVPEGEGSTTPVTSTLTAKWRVYGQVTSTLTSKWRIYANVTSILTSKWRVYSGITSSLTSKWRILGGVVSTLTVKWRLFERVTTILRSKWSIEGSPAPEPTVSSAYLIAQRAVTAAFIANDPTTIELVPHPRVKTASGGYSYSDGVPRMAQTVKMVELSNDQRPTTTVAGVERVIDYHLVGPWDMAIEVGDTWDADDGTTWEILGFSEGWDYMTKAFVGRHIPRSARA